MRTLLRRGRVVTAGDDFVADVLVDGERVAAVGESLDATADRVLDAAGRYVLPGGVDAHTHLDLPILDFCSSDDFLTGQRAAACGGTTCHIDFATQFRGQSLRQALDAWHLKARGKACIDYGFHMALTEVSESLLDEMDVLVAGGVTSFKLYLAYPGTLMVDDGELLRALQRCARNGALVMVHAENGTAIDTLVRQALARGDIAPRFHPLTRPPELEGEATGRAIALAAVAGAPLYVVHVTCVEALEAIRRARRAGQRVYGETCPQYLYLSQERYEEPGFEGAKYVMSPPLRPAGHADALWQALCEGDLQLVATDHCPFVLHAGFEGLPAHKERGRDDFSKIPGGAAGIETRMDLMHTGVAGGRIGLRRFVELCCTAPARMFGLYPRKGTVEPGSDADLVVYDPAARRRISAADLHQRVDYTPFEGLEVTGAVDTVLLRGKVIVEHGAYVGTPGEGRYLPRARSGWEP
jgi:dihydropyrimidinase